MLLGLLQKCALALPGFTAPLTAAWYSVSVYACAHHASTIDVSATNIVQGVFKVKYTLSVLVLMHAFLHLPWLA